MARPKQLELFEFQLLFSSFSRRFRAAMRCFQSFGQIKIKNKKVYGLTDKPAKDYGFECEEMGGKVTVEQYFQHKHGLRLKYPDLPCVQVGTATNCVPMEYVYVMGGLLVKLSRK